MTSVTEQGRTNNGQAHNDAVTVAEFDIDTLVLSDAAVEVGVRKVIGLNNLAASHDSLDYSLGDKDRVGCDVFFGEVQTEEGLEEADREDVRYLSIVRSYGRGLGFIVTWCTPSKSLNGGMISSQ